MYILKKIAKFNNARQIERIPFSERVKTKSLSISRSVSKEETTNYWSAYREIFDAQKEKLWEAILIGLNKYYEILRERHNLCSETESLKKQNIELQRLLESYVNVSFF